MGVKSGVLAPPLWICYLERGSLMDIGEERKMVEFDPLETDTPAPVETPAPASPAPMEAPVEEPVGV
jgi:hypothetical protein